MSTTVTIYFDPYTGQSLCEGDVFALEVDEEHWYDGNIDRRKMEMIVAGLSPELGRVRQV